MENKNIIINFIKEHRKTLRQAAAGPGGGYLLNFIEFTMNQFVLLCASVLLLSSSTVILGLSYCSSNNVSDMLSLTDVEANASGESRLSQWWNSPDYVCDRVQCTPFIISEIAIKVKKGTGNVAHSWDCNDCSTYLGDGSLYF